MIELVIFRTGGVEIGRSSFVPGASDAKSFAPVWSALLRTPEGNILFDTGLHPVHVDRPDATFGPGSLKVVMAKEDAIVARLLSLGVHPDEIAVVVNSHLHFDHAGNNGAFPKATFVVQADHLAFAKGKPNFPGVYWDIPELTYLPTSGRAHVAPGVEVVLSRWWSSFVRPDASCCAATPPSRGRTSSAARSVRPTSRPRRSRWRSSARW